MSSRKCAGPAVGVGEPRERKASSNANANIASFDEPQTPGLAIEVSIADIAVPADRLRPLRPEIVEQLAGSMQTIGQLQHILIRRRVDRGFYVVAGRHRFEAAKALGWLTIRAIVTGDSGAELAEIDENLIRADLSPAERALHVARRKELYELQHPETKQGAAPAKRCGKGGKLKSQNENFTFVADTAAKTGKGRSTVARDATRGSKVTVLADVVGTSLDQGDELDALAGLPDDVQRKLADRAKAGEKITAKHAANVLRREARERELAAATEAASQQLGKKLYGVIYTDPPWPFKAYSSISGLARSPQSHYPCMEIEQIAALPVPAADNCVLFIWSTVPHLPNALAVISAWGFKYRAHVVWKKDGIALGYWFRNVHEMLLVATRGDVPAPAMGTQFLSVIEAPRGEHSEKPAVFADMIEQLFPTVSRLEMFARSRRPGWDAWGNEVEIALPNAPSAASPPPLDSSDPGPIPEFLDRRAAS
jgi:N6-adenosine-specific RNA methylase IME4